jgi:hypothetical protein
LQNHVEQGGYEPWAYLREQSIYVDAQMIGTKAKREIADSQPASALGGWESEGGARRQTTSHGAVEGTNCSLPAQAQG